MGFEVFEEDGLETIFKHMFKGQEVDGLPDVLTVVVPQATGG